MEECGELVAFVNERSEKWDFEKITAEAADVANFAMMIQDAVREYSNVKDAA
jgi:NTP pyrophosphatase (non-canonical NTP hydrolase)